MPNLSLQKNGSDIISSIAGGEKDGSYLSKEYLSERENWSSNSLTLGPQSGPLTIMPRGPFLE